MPFFFTMSPMVLTPFQSLLSYCAGILVKPLACSVNYLKGDD